MATNFILSTNSIYDTNSVIKKLDSLIREEVFPRNAWDTPVQRIDENGTLTIEWKIENIHGLKRIRFTVDPERVVSLSFFNGKEFKPFDWDSDYSGFSWLVQQQLYSFHNFYTSYLKRVEK